MGFMNVLKFSAACFDFLGWPLFALGYPLCASIWVIETNSISDMRKVVTYWVVFSLISLFDYAFGKLLEWIPFWPHIKLIIICTLVIPHFDGACYVYQHFVNPFLSMDPQVVINWFLNESKNSFHGRESFLVAADRYVKENGAEALEKLLAIKSIKTKVQLKEIEMPAVPEINGERWKCEDPTVAQKEIQVVPPTHIKNLDDGEKRCEGSNVAEEVKVIEQTQRTLDAPAQWVNRTEINLGEMQRDATFAAEMMQRATVGVYTESEACSDNRIPEKTFQKEWACAMCQVTTQSEVTLNSHLQGKRHKTTSEQLKAKKNGNSAASTVRKPDDAKQKDWACAICQVTTQSEVTLNSHLQGKRHKATYEQLQADKNGTPAASIAKKPDDTIEDEQQRCASSNGLNQEENNKKLEEKAQASSEINEHGQQKNLKQAINELKELGQQWCNICNVTCPNDHIMASHLSGKKHLNRIKYLSKLWCSICNAKCPSEVDMASHKYGKRHLEQLKERSALWCSICSLSCSTVVDMNSHLNGRRHLEQIELQLKSWCCVCNVLCKSDLSLASHLKGKRHLEKISNT